MLSQQEQQHQTEEEEVSESMLLSEEREWERENHRWSSGTDSTTSSRGGNNMAETYFEMVNGPSLQVSGTPSKRGPKMVVVVIEHTNSTVFHLLHPEHHPHNISSLQQEPDHDDNDNEGDPHPHADHLDATLLPDFFSYTREERERIRRNQPIRSCPMTFFFTDNPFLNQPDSPLQRVRRSESKPYHLPTPKLLPHLTSNPPLPTHNPHLLSDKS